MGLDMYLERRVYVRSGSTLKITGIKSKINPEKVRYIVEDAGYWRKANAIHAWFVNNVQDGNDDCRAHYVDIEQLKELLHIVEEALEASELVDGEIQNGQQYADGAWKPIMEKGKCIKDPSVARELLPTQSGFFFGSTDYDQYYYAALEEIKAILEAAIADSDGEYYYQSSW